MRAPVVLVDGLAQLLEGVVGAEDAHVDVVLEVVVVVDEEAVVEDVERGVVEDLLRVGDVVVDGLGLLLGALPDGGRRTGRSESESSWWGRRTGRSESESRWWGRRTGRSESESSWWGRHSVDEQQGKGISTVSNIKQV